MNSGEGDSGRGRGNIIPLAEWIALSAALLEKQQAAEARREANLAYVGRAATISLLIVDRLIGNQSGQEYGDDDSAPVLQANDLSLENFALEISSDSDIEDLQKSPEMILSSDVVAVVQIPGSQPSADEEGGHIHIQTLPATLQKIGTLLYQLFSRGNSPPSNDNNSVESAKSNDVSQPERNNGGSESQSSSKSITDTQAFGRGDNGEYYDHEQPGAQKGRQKRWIGDACKSLRRIHISDLEGSMSQLSLPLSISNLLKDLIESGDDDEYECAFRSLEDVSSELRQILDHPNLFLFGQDDGRGGVLAFDGIIVGRTEEVHSLLEAAARIERAVDDPSQPNILVLVDGESGAGKSYLVESVCGSLMERGWIHLSCKFDRLMQANTLSVIASSFENFFQQVASLVSEGGDVGDILSSVQDSLSASGIVVLSELIPSLQTLYPAVFASIVEDDFSDSSEEERTESKRILSQQTLYPAVSASIVEDDASDFSEEERTESKSIEYFSLDGGIVSSAETHKNRLHYLFRRLVDALSSREHPLFLWLDDLQWADESSMQLVSSLLTDSDHLSNENDDAQPLLVVGSYRNTEFDSSHILATYLYKFEVANSVNVQNIHLGAMSKSNANVLVSEALRLPVRQTRGLTDVLYDKTMGGNPLFLTQILKSLVDERVLSYSLVDRRWGWDIKSVKATSIDDNVAVLLTRKLKRLPEDVQKALLVASCFGQKFDRILLESKELCKIIPHLDVAREEGILGWDGQAYKFPHDMIQQATYEVMSGEERVAHHFSIGVQLAAHLSSCKEVHNFHPLMFAAADQINIAKSLISTEHSLGDLSMQVEFAKLNLKAGERSMEVSDFISGLNYLEYGISFLPESRWDADHYELSLRLYDSSCLACYINARPDKMTQFLAEILGNAKSYDDTLKGLFVIVQSLTSSGKLKESMTKVFSILDELEVSFPESEVTPAHIQQALASTKKMLDGYSKEDLISAPRLNSKRLYWAVKLMAYISPYLFMLKPQLMPFVAFRIIDISTRHGFCNESAFGIFTYAYCSMAILHDINEAHRWAKIAISLLENFGAKHSLPRMKILCYHMILLWKEPLQSTSVALLQSHREALLVGDNEFGSLGAHFYCAQNILRGSYLPVFEKECTAVALKMIQLNQMPSCVTHLTNHQLVLRLTGSNKNPFEVLGGLVNSEDELLQNAISTGRIPLCKSINFNRLFVAFYFKRYDEAKEAVNYARMYEQRVKMLKDIYYRFYEGLLAFHLSRCTNKDDEPSEHNKWMEVGEKAVASFKTWVEHSTWNWEHKFLLLEAEWNFSKGEMKKADCGYHAAIESVRQHRFVHEEGLANELFSAFHTSNGDLDKAKSHVSKARACYEKWGAQALVDLLDSSEQ